MNQRQRANQHLQDANLLRLYRSEQANRTYGKYLPGITNAVCFSHFIQCYMQINQSSLMFEQANRESGSMIFQAHNSGYQLEQLLEL